MNKRPRLSKSGVEYLDYSWGIWSGCRNLETGNCSVKACWAKGLALHYPRLYPNGFEPTYYSEAIDSPKHLRKPSRISVGWVGDIIGYCYWQSIAKDEIFDTIEQCPQHRFLFLTKNPDKLFTWGRFPDNAWVGQSITQCLDNLHYFRDVGARVKFISFEPLQYWSGDIDVTVESFKEVGISWVIIGAQTKPTVYPKIEWVREIVEAADKAGAKVFLKDSLIPLVEPYGSEAHFFNYSMNTLRREVPDTPSVTE